MKHGNFDFIVMINHGQTCIWVVWKGSCSQGVELSAKLCDSAATNARLDVWAAGSFCLSDLLTLKVRRAKFAAYPSRVLKHSRLGTVPTTTNCHTQSVHLEKS